MIVLLLPSYRRVNLCFCITPKSVYEQFGSTKKKRK